jgi:hypothetical protein
VSSTTSQPSTLPSAGGTSTANSTPIAVNIFLNATTSNGKISDYCNAISSSSSSDSGSPIGKPCACSFSWNQAIQSGSVSSALSRRVLTTITQTQPYLAQCTAPDVYATEILNGTQLNVTIVPSIGNPNAGLFTVNTYTYTVGSSQTATTGSFQDSTGNFFDNILRYSCYQTYQRGMSVQAKSAQLTQSVSQQQVTYYYASQFCVSKGTGGGGAANGCNAPAPDYSAQSNYFNLYIRNSESGNINQFNSGFVCPLVKEALNSTNNVGTQNQFWPLDSTFALSLSPTRTFTIGVTAQTQLANPNDTSPTNATLSNTCYPVGLSSPTANSGSNAGTNGGGSPSSSSGFISSCLGFAAPPNPDGSCPTFRSATNQIQPTYRLRRYVALYPAIFDSDGSRFPGVNQGLDTIYVLDRPVKVPNIIGALKTATIAGPKPCPFAYFDRKGVTSWTAAGPGYVATNNTAWNGSDGNGTNVDGVEFPNTDGLDLYGAQSCSAALPLLTPDHTAITIQTVNIKNNLTQQPGSRQHAYIRPSLAWTPYYIEDNRFQACAPQANPFKDPPLHFARDPVSNRVAWCAEAYPTQSDTIATLDPPFNISNPPVAPSGTVSPYTSHAVKNSNSDPCSATLPSIPARYPLGGIGRHAAPNQVTCDRTVIIQAAEPQWGRFPLLAPASDVENALTDPATTSSYQCQFTSDTFGTKGASPNTPSTGCCDPNSVSVTSNPAPVPSAAHLEPSTPCKIPSY